jgi:hypothetical protein
MNPQPTRERAEKGTKMKRKNTQKIVDHPKKKKEENMYTSGTFYSLPLFIFVHELFLYPCLKRMRGCIERSCKHAVNCIVTHRQQYSTEFTAI